MSAPKAFPRPSGAVARRGPPVGRLASLKSPQPTGTPIRRPQAQGREPPRPVRDRKDICPNPNCPAPQIIRDENMKVCAGCGTVISEENIVSEVTFGETASGAAIVQGSYVGADQTHTRSHGPGFHRGGGMESREITEQNGNRYINTMSQALGIPESATKAASQIFKLAVGLNFIQGRRTKTVAAVALYIACRRQSGNTVMLIDLADVLMINVFKLGRAYKLLLEELRLGGTVFLMNPVDPENLIYRFARQLEFGNKTMQVAKEACRIVQRMNRDWMTTGRRPAGICGAALILAARMNNFRRTVREVVYVVKVTEVTINQRLNEFSTTDSGDLTVDQFRSVQLESAHDPPSFTHSKIGKNRKRKAAEPAAETENNNNNKEASTSQPANKKARVDADGFAIPELPVDPALTSSGGQATSTTEESDNAATASSSAGTDDKPKPKRKRAPLPQPTAEDIASEEALENEMNQYLAQGSDMVEAAYKKTETPATTAAAAPPQRKPVSNSEEIDEAEFESDPEVANCLLTPAEVEIKERIWVHENKDYLRAQQAKALKRALSQADGARSGAPKVRKRRKGRMGDVGYLKDSEGGGSRASTPAEATRMMLEQRGYSKKINYKLLETLYGEEGAQEAAKAKAENASSRASRSQSVVSRRSATAEPEPSRPPQPAEPSRPVGSAAPTTTTTSTTPASSGHVSTAPTTAAKLTPAPPPSAVGAAPDEPSDDGEDDFDDEDDDYGDDDRDVEDEDQARLDAAFSGTYAEQDYYDEGSDYDYD